MWTYGVLGSLGGYIIQCTMAILDTSGSWVSGDDVRCLRAMGMGFSEYNLGGLVSCMNQLQVLSDGMVLAVREELDRYESAYASNSTSNAADTEGKVLVKADVLSWEVTGNKPSGLQREMMDARHQIMRAFEFCPYTPKDNGMGANTSVVYRS